jgi:hypothetical protein
MIVLGTTKVVNHARSSEICNVTPYFLKRIEFHKFIYLNKYLIVTFHADAYFPLCGEVLLYFVEQVEVVGIQI